MIIKKKEWESDFYDRALFSVIPPVQKWNYNDIPDFRKQLEETLADAQSGIYEFELDARYLFLSATLEDMGFRLWDSRYQFITLFKKSELPHYKYTLPESARIRAYRPDDLDAVLEINEAFLIHDDQLISKYKSPFFEEGSAAKWFTAWVRNSLEEGALCSVLEESGAVKGYFIYADKGQHKDLTLFKGILSSIHPDFRGLNLHLALQEYILKEMIDFEAFYIDNTTQISNMPIVKNHFSSRRYPSSIKLVFLKQV